MEVRDSAVPGRRIPGSFDDAYLGENHSGAFTGGMQQQYSQYQQYPQHGQYQQNEHYGQIGQYGPGGYETHMPQMSAYGGAVAPPSPAGEPKTPDKLDEIRKTVENARSMPMSASCVINRNELLSDLSELAHLLPVELAEAQRVLADRDNLIEQGRAEANRLIEEGRRQRDLAVSQTDIYHAAQQAAEEMRAQVESEAAALRRETDDYVDHKLAGFEIALQKTLATIGRGRDRLRSRVSHWDESDEVAVQRRETDEYVDHKLTRFEHSLQRTLDAVSRGRERLRSRSELDTYATGDEEQPLHGE
ncbi:hypothetical protein GCM10027569_64070 [Flindersiella endophytica]